MTDRPSDRGIAQAVLALAECGDPDTQDIAKFILSEARDYDAIDAHYAAAPQPQDAARDRVDAERYRLLRRGQKWSVINGIGDELRADALDAAIDAARGAGGGRA